ncbi:histidine phosphatase superfamily [Gautieria morchelliformis]|nr:histidine phosphatase superfamily [Gautieria morchelliformis]
MVSWRRDTLTEYGREQARRLGERWANVRIDALYTSPYKRAKDTAQLLADNNHSHPEPIDCAGLVEHDFGPVVRQLMAANRHEEARCERTRTNVWGLPDRNHRPSGGDSLEDLVHRGISELRDIVLRHAVPLPAQPEEMSQSDYTPRGTVDKLVKDVPHVVIVSHNIFLAELGEALESWNEPKHVDTNNDYLNAGWSRHVLKIQGHGTNRPEKGYYAMKFPFDMQIKDLVIAEAGMLLGIHY